MNRDRINYLKSFKGVGMTSAMDDYVPDEFWEVLNELERLQGVINEIRWDFDTEDDYELVDTLLDDMNDKQRIDFIVKLVNEVLGGLIEDDNEVVGKR